MAVVVTRVLIAGLFLCLMATSGALAAGKRVALVIGNSDYQFAPQLANPRNDAADMAAALRALGFTVISGLDLDRAGMDERMHAFARAVVGAEVGVFFYAGHGLQVAGQNYLVPVDAKLATAAALEFETVRLELVQRTMEREAKANVIFLDACRNNPLARNLARAMGTRSAAIGRGLAAIESGVGTLISFATQPGNVALDGEGRNSPFTGALVRHLQTKGEDLSSLLIKVRNDVMTATRDQQVPWEHTALRAKLYFAGLDPAGVGGRVGLPNSEQPGGPFDGVWRVTLTGGPRCSARALEHQIRIVKSVVQPFVANLAPGRVSSDGVISYTTPSKNRPDLVVRYDGQLSGLSGEGTYRVLQGPCTGTFVMSKLEPPSTPALPPHRGLGPFDGSWEVTMSNNEFCPSKIHTFKITIANSMILARQPEPGHVDANGTFRFSTYGFVVTTNVLQYMGSLRGDTGQGSYQVTGHKCGGNLMLKRLDPAAGSKPQ